MHTCEWLSKHAGFEVTYVPVDKHGLVDPEAVRAAVRDDTAIISIMYANNEVGTIEPIAAIGEIAKERHIPFHTDAVQAGGALSLDVQALNVDLLSLSAHKFYGPKGVGVLYTRKAIPYLPTMTGGGQERGRRAGTENVAFAVGLAAALRIAHANRDAENARVQVLRDSLIARVLAAIPSSQLTGHPTLRLPNSASFAIEYVEGEAMLLSLDMEGICASSGSACTSGSLEPSHVLTGMGYTHEVAHGSLRLTLGHSSSAEQINRVLAVLPGIVNRLRAMSPLAPATLPKCKTG
jgi:cysteine desulfurase